MRYALGSNLQLKEGGVQVPGLAVVRMLLLVDDEHSFSDSTLPLCPHDLETIKRLEERGTKVQIHSILPRGTAMMDVVQKSIAHWDSIN